LDKNINLLTNVRYISMVSCYQVMIKLNQIIIRSEQQELKTILIGKWHHYEQDEPFENQLK
jgi:hypothetical protein